MGEKATINRLSFEAVVGLMVILISLVIHMVSFVSNTWFWHAVRAEGEEDPVMMVYLGVWKKLECAHGAEKCTEKFDIPGWAKATAAFCTIALMVHLAAATCAFLYVFWYRNKRFMSGGAIAIILSGCVKCLSALIFGAGASLSYDRVNSWLDWAFALLLISMSLDWVCGLILVVENTEAKNTKPDEHRRGPKNQLGIGSV